jgi:hypothetical protein
MAGILPSIWLNSQENKSNPQGQTEKEVSENHMVK